MNNQPDLNRPFLDAQSHLYYNLAILITGALIFIFVPLYFLTPEESKQFLNNGRELQVVLDMLVLILGFYLIVGAYYWMMVLFRVKEIGATHIMFIFAWVALAGFLLPLTDASGMFLLRHAQTQEHNLWIVTILSAVLAVLFVSRYAKIAQIFMAIFILLAILPTLPRAFSLFEKQDGIASPVKLSPEKNLILVGFDGVPGHVMKEVLLSLPTSAQTFKDFTYYTNVASSSPATKASLRGIVYGNYDFTKYKSPVWTDDKELYFNQQEKVNFITGHDYNYYNQTGTKLAAGQYGGAEQRNELFELYRNVAVRIATKFGVNLMEGIDAFLFPDRKGKFYSTVEGFDKVVNSLNRDSDKPTVLYTHFTFTHSPLTIDENCADRRMDWGWFRDHQNIQGLNGVAVCALDKYTELIAKLKALGVYDQSTIILLSDHGQFVSFYDQPPHNLKINDGPSMGFDRYQPFLMIKPAGQTTDAITMSDKYVVIDDLAQTTCYLFETAEVCEQSPGLNILDDTDVAPDDFYIHVVRDEKSDWAVIDHKAVQISRKIPLEQAMRESPEIILSEPPPAEN